MSNHLEKLPALVAQGIVRMQNATGAVDEAAAALLKVNSTDLRCLSILLCRGSMPPSELASLVHLTRAAVTTVLDRLEKRGLTRRTPDTKDRRSILIEVTPAAQKLVKEIWGPIQEEGLKQLGSYSSAELQFLIDFLDKAAALQETHAERIRSFAVRRTRSAR